MGLEAAVRRVGVGEADLRHGARDAREEGSALAPCVGVLGVHSERFVGVGDFCVAGDEVERGGDEHLRGTVFGRSFPGFSDVECAGVEAQCGVDVASAVVYLADFVQHRAQRPLVLVVVAEVVGVAEMRNGLRTEERARSVRDRVIE